MKLSIAVPTHNMENAAGFLRRLMQSLEKQTFQDFEIVITKDGKMAENTNAAIKKCKGEIIKIMYMDDYFAHENSLQNTVQGFKGGWLATGCLHDSGNSELDRPHLPHYNGIPNNSNTIGSPSVIAFENSDSPILFDEQMTWVLDLDYYKRLFEKYGEPTVLDTYDIAIGTGGHQMTYKLTDEERKNEELYFLEKWKTQN